MPKPIAQQAGDLRALRERVKANAHRRLSAGFVATAEAAARGTPVNEGSARASWESGLDSAPAGNRAPYVAYPPGSAAKNLADGKFNETANVAGVTAMAEAAASSRRIRGDGTLILRNAVVNEQTGRGYLDELNSGKSPQNSVGRFWEAANRIGLIKRNLFRILS